ncbi:hypothetical protein AB0H43_14010 [Hamadaea sp. NPDC050747]|uniref:hypothetical protein n=1 Tax=Hamadaea sp. NPDC050747 TaxID=3155789 RepID=UPI0033C1A256
MITTRSHQPLAAVIGAPGGLSSVFAGTLLHADGTRLFVKAAPATTAAARGYRREALIASRLPLTVPSARLRWHTEADGWIILAFDAADGDLPDSGWSTSYRDTLVSAWRATTAALTAASPALRSAARRPQPLPAGWADVAAGRRSLPAEAGHLTELAPQMSALEAGFLTGCDRADRLAHFDLRPDNIILGDDRVWIVDWATLQPAPTWIDVLILAVAASSDGADPDAFFDAFGTGADTTEVDQALAWMAGAWLTYAAGPPRPDAPQLRAFQLHHGTLTWRWLAARRNLPTTTTTRFASDHSADLGQGA